MAVAICTAIMRRARDLNSSEMIFMDSTASCDDANHVVTFILAPSSAGAVPLGAIIT